MYVCAGWCLVGFISLILYGFFYLLEGVSMISMGTLTLFITPCLAALSYVIVVFNLFNVCV